MTLPEIATALTSGLIGPGIGAMLVVLLALWRWYRGVGPMSLRAEALHLAGAVVPIAACALIMGQSWKVVAVVTVTAVLTACGWNSSAAIPPLVPAADAPPKRTEP
jgi:hypothetical protein